MNIIIKGNHLEITSAINDYGMKRLEAISKFLGPDALVELELLKTTNHHKSGDIFKAEINIDNKGDLTRAGAEEADLYASIDKVRDEVMRILASKKGRKQSLWLRGKQKIKSMLQMRDRSADETGGEASEEL